MLKQNVFKKALTKISVKPKTIFMITKLKFFAGIVAVSAALAFTSPYTEMFGKSYNINQDFSCCKNNQLVIHHAYTTRLFWININKGYDLEPVGKPTTGCNVSCD